MGTIKSAFDKTNDADLCGEIFSLYAEINNAINVAHMSEHERIVSLTYHFAGIIDNGGFGYLYSANIKGDPHYRITADAFRTIGCKQITSAFEESFKWFPDQTPPADVDERRRLLALVNDDEKTRAGRLFWQQSKCLEDFLGPYIRTHRDAIEKDLRSRFPWPITRRLRTWRHRIFHFILDRLPI